VCFIGHSHRSIIFEELNSNVYETESVKDIENARYIINVGSVGQPRDGDQRLSFGFIDTNEFKYCNYRFRYPAETASKKILFEGLPPFLAERILKGV
jgi:diadenosine tetraphosphatase ApaH/serine/threonine PP2A family protein phosphatase